MNTLGQTAARATASTLIDVIDKKIGKDREEEMVKLIDFMEKYMSGEKMDIDYDKAREELELIGRTWK